ncbi:MAG: NUDIX hydrolase [Fidelibacterota bacterium]
MKTPQLVRFLEKQLAGPLPGAEAQEKMAPVPRTVPSYSRPEEAAIPSAVLILMFPSEDRWFFVLTERSSDVEHHQGQVSLPGGAQEGGESLQQTALRETEEELGIDSQGVTVLGKLTPLFIPVSGFRVHPFVGWAHGELEMHPDPVEVRSVHFAPVDQLLDEGLVTRETREIGGIEIDVPYFQFDTVKVWGATAIILSEFREIIVQASEKSGLATRRRGVSHSRGGEIKNLIGDVKEDNP